MLSQDDYNRLQSKRKLEKIQAKLGRHFFAALLEQDVSEVLRLLNECPFLTGVRTDRGAPPLVVTAGLGHLELIKVLLDAGASPLDADLRGITPLAMAAYHGRDKVIHLLLQTQQARGASPIELLSTTTTGGETPLMAAAKKGFVSTMRYLIAAGADVHAGSRDGLTPLHLAAASGWGPAVSELLVAGADPSRLDHRGRTPLMYAAASGSRNALQLLLESKYTPPEDEDVTTDEERRLGVDHSHGHVKKMGMGVVEEGPYGSHYAEGVTTPVGFLDANHRRRRGERGGRSTSYGSSSLSSPGRLPTGGHLLGTESGRGNGYVSGGSGSTATSTSTSHHHHHHHGGEHGERATRDARAAAASLRRVGTDGKAARHLRVDVQINPYGNVDVDIHTASSSHAGSSVVAGSAASGVVSGNPNGAGVASSPLLLGEETRGGTVVGLGVTMGDPMEEQGETVGGGGDRSSLTTSASASHPPAATGEDRNGFYRSTSRSTTPGLSTHDLAWPEEETLGGADPSRLMSPIVITRMASPSPSLRAARAAAAAAAAATVGVETTDTTKERPGLEKIGPELDQSHLDDLASALDQSGLLDTTVVDEIEDAEADADVGIGMGVPGEGDPLAPVLSLSPSPSPRFTVEADTADTTTTSSRPTTAPAPAPAGPTAPTTSVTSTSTRPPPPIHPKTTTTMMTVPYGVFPTDAPEPAFPVTRGPETVEEATEWRDSWGRTPLMAACAKGQLETTQFLVGIGCDLTVVDTRQAGLLHLAAASGSVETVRYLLYDAIAESNRKRVLDATAGVVRNVGVNPTSWHLESRARRGLTPLMAGAVAGKGVGVLEELLVAGASLEATDDRGRTVLMRAAAGGETEMCQWLVAKGARMDARDGQGMVARALASKYGHGETAEVLARLARGKVAAGPPPAPTTTTTNTTRTPVNGKADSTTRTGPPPLAPPRGDHGGVESPNYQPRRTSSGPHPQSSHERISTEESHPVVLGFKV